MRVPWTARGSNQSILKEINPNIHWRDIPILWPPDVKNWFIGKDSDAGRDWGQEEKETTEDEMVGWHHRLMDLSMRKLRELVIDREVWHDTVHGVAKSWTPLSD